MSTMSSQGVFRIALATLGLLAVAAAGHAVAESEPGLEEERAEAAAETSPDAEPAMDASAEGSVARSGFTRAVVDREPTDTVATLSTDTDEVSYFTELRDLEGEHVVHRWMYGGEVLAEVGFDVGGPRWRVHSTKQLDPTRTGEWTVSVVDASGRTLSEERFTYTEAPAAPSGTPADTAADAPTDAPEPQAEAGSTPASAGTGAD